MAKSIAWIEKSTGTIMTVGFVLLYITLFVLSFIFLYFVYSRETLDKDAGFLHGLQIVTLIAFYMSVCLNALNSTRKYVTNKSRSSESECQHNGKNIDLDYEKTVVISTLMIPIKNLFTMGIIYLPTALIASVVDIIISITTNKDGCQYDNIVGLIFSSLESNIFVRIVIFVAILILIAYIVLGVFNVFFNKLTDKFLKLRDTFLKVIGKLVRPFIVSTILIYLLQIVFTNGFVNIFNTPYFVWALPLLLFVFALIILRTCGVKGIQILIDEGRRLYYDRINPLSSKLKCGEAKTNEDVVTREKTRVKVQSV